jgi:acetyl esterase/lipase
MGNQPEIPAALLSLMQEVGPVWGQNVPKHVQLMIDQFSLLLSTARKEGVTVKRDISYGQHPRQRFDIYSPDHANGPRPAVLFVHGGAFVDGDKNRNEEIYANVHYCFARHGVVGVNIGYRLATDAGYPAATQDVAAVVNWISRNAEEFNVDTSRVFLMGHSAGAAHTGSYVYDKRFRQEPSPRIAGHIVVSGRVRADNRSDNPNASKVEVYYGNDKSFLDKVSPVSHVDRTSIPTFVTWGEFENPLIDVYCSELVYRLAVAKGRTPPCLWLKGHNHTSTIAHLNTADDLLEKAMVDFIQNPS